MPGLTQGAALDSIDAVARQLLPPGTTTALAGESREYKESGSAIYFAFVIALIVVFMVLASQFESLLHPLTVLVAVPLAVTGALATLKLAAILHRSGATLNLRSEEHTSELQSQSNLVCRLLLEKKKKKIKYSV